MSRVPLMVNLTGRSCVIIGGGNVAYKRVEALYESGADIKIISPELSPLLQEKVINTGIEWVRKRFQPGDIKGAYLVVAAANDQSVNHEVVRCSHSIPLVNAAHDAEQANVQFPGYFSRGKLTISVSTNGASPLLATAIKQKLEGLYEDTYESYVDFLYECRQLLKKSALSSEEKKGILKKLLDQKFMEGSAQQSMKQWIKQEIEAGERI